MWMDSEDTKSEGGIRGGHLLVKKWSFPDVSMLKLELKPGEVEGKDNRCLIFLRVDDHAQLFNEVREEDSTRWGLKIKTLRSWYNGNTNLGCYNFLRESQAD